MVQRLNVSRCLSYDLFLWNAELEIGRGTQFPAEAWEQTIYRLTMKTQLLVVITNIFAQVELALLLANVSLVAIQILRSALLKSKLANLLDPEYGGWGELYSWYIFPIYYRIHDKEKATEDVIILHEKLIRINRYLAGLIILLIVLIIMVV
jgi:hypothetical protein